MDQSGRGGRLGGGGSPAASARQRASVGEGVHRITYPGTGRQVYRISFTFRGVSCRETIDLPHSRPNDQYCLRFRADVLGNIARGTFDYTEFWPDSAKARTFGHGVESRMVPQALADYRDRAEATLEHTTWAVYRRDIDNVLIPAFRGLAMADLRATHVRDFVTAPERAHMSIKRLRNLLLPLRTVCDDAVADGILQANPVAALKLAKLVPIERRTTDYEPDPYTEPELTRILASMPEPARWVFTLWAYTGMRTGELIGLRWSAINLQARRLTVAGTTSLGQDKARAKTTAGLRTFDLLPAAMEAVEAMRPHTQLAGDRWARNPRSTTPDKCWRENKLEAAWKRAHAGTGIRPRAPYQLRHTFASNLLSQGANLADIANRLGHKTTEMVIKHYGRWVAEAAAARWNDPAAGYGQCRLADRIRNAEGTAARAVGEN